MSEYLFTYGTLRLDQSHPMAHFLAENASLVGLGILTKARLYRIDWYPALIETNDEQEAGFIFIIFHCLKMPNS